VVTKFGIRSFSFDATNGFTLNGIPTKLKGGCVHHDNGPLGAKAYDRAEERRVELLKASGYNAIRCAHNPPSPAFLDACDRLGMLVINEAFDMWETGKHPFDYHLFFKEWWQKDLESMILRDRNHPSVIMWSIGNEIPGMNTPEVVNTAKMLADHARKLDPTRPVTAGVNQVREDKDPFFENLDIAGYNYAFDWYKKDHQRHPKRVMVATESSPFLAFEYWMGVVDNPWVIGDFVWTSFDYIGEASIGWRGFEPDDKLYPWSLAYCGDIDICGWKRPQSFYRDVLWKPNQISVFVKPPSPTFEINQKKEFWSQWEWHDVLADWTWPGNEGKPMEVSVYSSCEQVELFLNGKSLGKKITNRTNKFTAMWNVPYQSGTLKAIGYTKGKKVNESVLETSGAVERIHVLADRTELVSGKQDLCFFTVELIDSKGVRNPKAENTITFQVEGPGEIVGLGNANPVSLESYQGNIRNAWQGKCLVIIKAGANSGKVTLKAMTDSGIAGEATILLNSIITLK
jgi:beta-galactosidase